jgi:cytochrome c biogenesis protein CcmG/thiol:disulfide interchange protein DsbE
MHQKRQKAALLVLLALSFVLIILFLLWHHRNTSSFTLKSLEPIPSFDLANLWHPDQSFTQDALQQHDIALLHIWATWCYACRGEHSFLMKMKAHLPIPLYSFNYQDKPLAARAWLTRFGDPFVLTGMDTTGKASLLFGVIVTPETILIMHGKIIFRYEGVLDESHWETLFLPLIKQYAHQTPSP